MELRIGHKDRFERIYREQFRSVAAKHGLILEYSDDRAAIDLGLHLTIPRQRYEGVTNARIWFQLKGSKTSTLSSKKYEKSKDIPVSRLKIDHLRQWYQSQEPVYLVVYVECANVFLAEDVRTIVDRVWGDRILNPATFKNNQQTTTLRIPKDSLVGDDFWPGLLRHRSMRIDGPSYRGNPLPHIRDYQSEILMRIEPTIFTDLINTILSEHGYKIKRVLDANPLYPDGSSSGDILSLSQGIMFTTYEWIPQLTAELGYDEEGFRHEGQVFRVQGPCAVMIHSNVVSRPSVSALKLFAKELAEQRIEHLLVFVNHYMYVSMLGEKPYNCFPEYSQSMSGSEIGCMPQHLEDLGRNILTATNVYLEFRDKLTWWGDYVKDRIKSGEWRIITL